MSIINCFNIHIVQNALCRRFFAQFSPKTGFHIMELTVIECGNAANEAYNAHIEPTKSTNIFKMVIIAENSLSKR